MVGAGSAITSFAPPVYSVIINDMEKRRKPVRHKKIIDDTIKLPEKQGNGILRFFVSVDEKNKIIRYSLAYINPKLCSVDNGRVLGYDNCHGYHHRHYMGKEENIAFTSYENIEKRFKEEWEKLHETLKDQNK